MKNNLSSSFLLFLALSALGIAFATNPPGGVRWGLLIEAPGGWFEKVMFLAGTYLLPAFLSFCAIVLFQLQFRLASSGTNKRIVFSVCVLASGAMLLGLRSISSNPSSGPPYVSGMALGYTVMARLYAIRLRNFFGRVRILWPVWRGNIRAVQEIDQMAKLRTGSAPACR